MGHRQGHAEGEQDGVGRCQADHAQHKLDNGGGEGALPQLLVLPRPLDQVNELGPGHLHAAEDHDQKEDQAEVQDGLPRRPGGEGQSQQLGHVQREHGQGESGQAVGGRHPQNQTGGQGDETDNPRLQKQQAGHLALAQPQQQIGAQLPLAPAQEKAVGIQNQAGQHNRHKDRKDID